MNYVGIHIHKKYSVACVRDEKGHIIRRERIEGNRVEGFHTPFEWRAGARGD